MPGILRDGEEQALERTKRLFRFLKAFAEQSIPVKRALAEQPWTLRLRDLPAHPAVSVGTVELAAAGEAPTEPSEPSEAALLIRVRRPTLTNPSAPPTALAGWVLPGWERWGGEVAVSQSRNRIGGRGEPVTERFDTDPQRVKWLDEWRARWEAWAAAERPARETMEVFDRLYQLRGRLELEGERVELMLGDGRLRWARAEGPVDHPVLLQRVELDFDPTVPEFRVIDSDRAPELYRPLLHGADGLTGERIIEIQRELEAGGYHPLERPGTSGFLKQLSALLSAHGEFRDDPSDEALPPDPVICRDPVLFLRARAFGLPAALDRVLADLDQSPQLPFAIMRVVGVEPPPPPPEGDAAPSPWGEPPDILFSKPANLEQIQIARALERHRAVLVQGPPGTGKSHTIANLIGHLVAQGKRVLVTAHTTKALRVLRGQVVEPLQPLCVAVLDNDLESRAQLAQAVRGIVSRLTTATEEGLSCDIQSWLRTREKLLEEVERLTGQLRDAREGEYRPILIAGEEVTPTEAAREVAREAGACAWLPGPLEPGAPLPLSDGELLELYETNRGLTPAEEQELAESLPPESMLPSAESFQADVASLEADEPLHFARFWERDPEPKDQAELEQIQVTLNELASELRDMTSWQLALVAAGHAGGSEAEPWRTLAAQVTKTFETWQRCRELLLEHAPEIESQSGGEATLQVLAEIQAHVVRGGGLGRFTLLWKASWKRVLRVCCVNGAPPTLPEHFAALAARLEIDEGRRKLAARWTRQVVPIGLPDLDTMPEPWEPVACDYVGQFERLLGWWKVAFDPLQDALRRLGLRWKALRAQEMARVPPRSPFERDRDLLGGALLEAVSIRAKVARRRGAEGRLRLLEAQLTGFCGPICSTLRCAVERRDPAGYCVAVGRLAELQRKAGLRERRIRLLGKVENAAPGWAQAVRERAAPHDAARPPGDARRAWRYRQLLQELERRAALDEISLMRRLEKARTELREATAALIDRMAWLAQLRRTHLAARQALVGWLDTYKKIGKRCGKRVPELEAEARKLLDKARDAVPVWIMPLARVAESFDPRRGRFDVVVVDEASQADVTGLLAWYLGDRVAIVGDDEQVSPLAVGQTVEVATALISEHLHGIPNSHLYDGKTSIYDLARQSFGGTIALREHFRCVPDIIEFSNHLSYGGQIRPLREPASAPLPHVVEYVVPAELGADKSGKTNLVEARVIAALVKAACEQPEYSGKTMGAITLLGDEQAHKIQELAVSLVGAVELEQRRFVAGNSAQYQGDERHLIWLSMVDVPTGTPLKFVDSQPIKQRFNVAASRAKDHLWLVHSLDPGRDLKAGDLRRRLIEHVRDPGARRRALRKALERAESPFEQEVIQRLVALGYGVQPQVEVGHYRIDLVVSDGRGQVAVECDGDRFHPFEKIPEDLARQAVLERAQWRFVRIRGTRFYRDPDGTMDWVVGELARLGVEPVGPEPTEEPTPEAAAQELKERLIRRAWEIMNERGWVPRSNGGTG